MQYREWHLYNKSSWRTGPWQQEPDRAQWLDTDTQLPCVATRVMPFGIWCGYVAIPPNHPLFGVHYGDIRDKLGDGDSIMVHGGLTYSRTAHDLDCFEFEEGDEQNLWVFGFDCCHCYDLRPVRMIRFGDIDEQNVYRDLDYVKDQCVLLARQLYDIAERRK